MNGSFSFSVDVAPDSYALFRGRFHLAASSEVEIRAVGSAWYQAWLDGSWLLEGPFRYAIDRPEYQVEKRPLEAGEHVLAFHAHHVGVDTRILMNTAPFLRCEVLADGEPCLIEWVCQPLTSQTSGARRINPQLGWIEWRDTRLDPAEWRDPELRVGHPAADSTT